ncbi:MAG: choice-of-anchor Q domain-containing protein [Acidobacteriota bacterium]
MTHGPAPALLIPALLLLASLIVPAPALAADPPVLFFSDLESGPGTGGEGGQGVFVTVWGRNFGAARGSSTVTVGAGTAAAYPVWSDTRVTFQLGPAASAGGIVLATAAGSSNALPFEVRPGSIHFVATSGDDANDGSRARPWATVVRAKEAMTAGDVTYLMDGVNVTAEENAGAAVTIERGGEPGRPLALVAYPGARATLGSTALEYGVRVLGDDVGDWVLAGLVLRGRIEAAEVGGFGSARWRVVGNDISCPVGDGQTGCFTAALASHVVFLGNEVHDVGTQSAEQPSKQYHAVYFTTDTNHVEVGWNHIHDNRTCRAVQFHSSPLCIPDCGPTDTTGFNQYDLSVHDNLIHGDVCDGIVFATVDPSKGRVRAYNNVIYDVGRGPAPPDGDANYTCVYVSGGTNTGSDGSGVVELFNNTLVDCGARALLPGAIGDEGMIGRAPYSPGLVVRLVDNVVVARSGESYISPSSDTSLIQGSNNLWFGAGAPPAFLAVNVGADPQFANLAGFDFHLDASSPAVDAGIETAAVRDLDGVPRPQGAAYDLGAYEWRSAAACTAPAISAQPQSATIYPGQSATLSVTATGSTPMSYQWYRGQSGSTAQPVAGASASSLSTGPLSVTTSFWVRVSNGCGSADSDTATVSVTGSGQSYLYLVPSVAHWPGVGGTAWRSDVAVVNRGAGAASVTLGYRSVTDAMTGSYTTTVASGGTAVWRDVLVAVLGLAADRTNKGTLHVSADQPLAVVSRTYNQTPSGTYGQFMPGLTAGNALTHGVVGVLPMLAQGQAYRTNAGIANLSAGGDCSVRFRVVGPTGAQLGNAVTLTAGAGRWVQQDSLLTAASAGSQDVASATAEVTTPGCTAWAYASVIDNATGDPVTVPVQVP